MRMKNKTWLAGAFAVLVLGLWHILDTRAGAVKSGDLWLISVYLWLLAAVLASLAVFGFLLEGRAVEKAYVPAGLLLGMMFLFVLPPLSAPDEVSHYISAYQLSSHILGKTANAPSGHVLVRAEDIWLEDRDGVYEYELGEGGYVTVTADSSRQNQVLGRTLTEADYRQIRTVGLTGHVVPEGVTAAALNAGADEKDIMVVSPYPPVVTTPLAYVPQALGIAAARLFHFNTVALLYAGRIFNLLFFVAMTYLAMNRLPFGKEVLFGVALLPMTLHLSASFSYDVMIMGCMFYLTAVCLDLAYAKGKVRLRDVAVLMVLMAAAGPCKMIYAVLAGLCLLIPVRKFGGWGKWFLAAFAVLGTWAAAMVLVNGQTVAAYAAETESYVSWAEEAGYSLSTLIHRPVLTLKLFYQTFLWQAEYYHLTMIGAYMGNLDQVLDVPYLVIVFFSLGLLGLAFRKPGESLVIPTAGRIWIGVLCLGCVLAAMVSMLIAWTPVSSPVISGVQGRYFLPFLPVLLMALKNNTVVLTKDRNRSILYLMCCADGYVLLRLFSIVSMRL